MSLYQQYAHARRRGEDRAPVVWGIVVVLVALASLVWVLVGSA